jgi:hypothetical protein
MTDKELFKKIDEFAEEMKYAIKFKNSDLELLGQEKFEKVLMYYAASMHCSSMRIQHFIFKDIFKNRALDFDVKNVAAYAFLIYLALEKA